MYAPSMHSPIYCAKFHIVIGLAAHTPSNNVVSFQMKLRVITSIFVGPAFDSWIAKACTPAQSVQWLRLSNGHSTQVITTFQTPEMHMAFMLVICAHATAVATDWLVDPPTTAVTITNTTVANGLPAIVLSNGLISRTFLIAPNWATWSLVEGGEDLLRSVQPAASFQLDNKTIINVGGVLGATNYAYKNSSDQLRTAPTAYQYLSHKIVPITKRYDWVPGTRFSQVVWVRVRVVTLFRHLCFRSMFFTAAAPIHPYLY